MAHVNIIPALLLIIPIVLMVFGLGKYKETHVQWALGVALAGLFLFFILGWIAFGFLPSVMVSIAIVTVYASKKGKKREWIWGHAIASCGSLVMFLAAFVSVSMHLLGCETKKQISKVMQQKEIIRDAQMNAIGNLLRTKLAGQNVLVVLNQAQERHQRNGLDALRKGLSSDVKIVGIVSPAIDSEDEFAKWEDIPPSAFDVILGTRYDYDVALMFVDFPPDAHKMEFWKGDSKRRPKVILATDSGYGLAQYIKLKWVDGGIIITPELEQTISNSYMPDSIDSKTLKGEIARGLLYIEAENLEVAKKTYPIKFSDNRSLQKLLRNKKQPAVDIINPSPTPTVYQ